MASWTMHSDRLITRNSNACICNNIEVYNLEGSLTQCFQKTFSHRHQRGTDRGLDRQHLRPERSYRRYCVGHHPGDVPGRCKQRRHHPGGHCRERSAGGRLADLRWTVGVPLIPTSPTQFGLVLVECLDLSIITSGNTNVRWRPRVAAPTPRVWSDLVPKSTTASPETTTQSPIVSQQTKCRNTPCLQFVMFSHYFCRKNLRLLHPSW